MKCLAYDQELADRLKEELQHETNRRKAYTEFQDEKKKTEKEQNKGLALWIEEQEQWDSTREKSVFEYKKNKRPTPQEFSKEYYADLAEKERGQRVVEEGRKQHIQIKKNIIAQYQPKDVVSEEEELAIFNQRPRYDLRKRGRNKWTKSGAGIGGGQSGASSGGYNSGGFQGGGDSFDFPPPPPADFGNVPQDNFDDFPPPPPPTSDFGNAPGMYDSGFGDAPIPPPPPPPPEGGWDF